jgi:hypothetical protein
MKAILTLFVVPVVRAILQVAGGTQIADENTTNQVVGALTILATVGWSIYEKHKARTKSAPPTS